MRWMLALLLVALTALAGCIESRLAEEPPRDAETNREGSPEASAPEASSGGSSAGLEPPTWPAEEPRWEIGYLVNRTLLNASFNLTAPQGVPSAGANFTVAHNGTVPPTNATFTVTVPAWTVASRLSFVLEDSVVKSFALGGVGTCDHWSPPGGLSNGKIVGAQDVKVIHGTLEDSRSCGIPQQGEHEVYVQIEAGAATGRLVLEATVFEAVA